MYLDIRKDKTREVQRVSVFIFVHNENQVSITENNKYCLEIKKYDKST